MLAPFTRSKAVRTLAWEAKATLMVLATLMAWGISSSPAQSGRVVPSSSAGSLASAVVLYSQPPSSGGGILLSSLREPEGSDTDQWAWDGFSFAQPQVVTEIRWRGAYDPTRRGSGGPVFDFRIEIYRSAASGTQPDIANPPLSKYELGGNAGEAAAGVLGGVQTYDYAFVLPAPFLAAGGAKYWVQIEAFQSGPPDWGLSAGLDGDGSYFRRIPSQGPGYQLVAGDAAFALLGPAPANVRIYLPLALGGAGG